MKIENLKKEHQSLYFSQVLFKSDENFLEDLDVFKKNQYNIRIYGKDAILNILKSETLNDENYTTLLNYILELYEFQKVSFDLVEAIRERKDLKNIIENINGSVAFFPSLLDLIEYLDGNNLANVNREELLKKMFYIQLGCADLLSDKKIISEDELNSIDINYLKILVPFLEKDILNNNTLMKIYKNYNSDLSFFNFKNFLLEKLGENRICDQTVFNTFYDSQISNEMKISLAKNPYMSEKILYSLATSENYEIQQALTQNKNLSNSTIIKFLENFDRTKNENQDLLVNLTKLETINKRVISKLLTYKNEAVDSALLRNEFIPIEILSNLINSVGKNKKSDLIANVNTPKIFINEIVKKGVLSDADKVNLLLKHEINLFSELSIQNIEKPVEEINILKNFLEKNNISENSELGMKLTEQYNKKIEELHIVQMNKISPEEIKKEKELLSKVEELAINSFR